jgi:hypothetical protein
MRDAPERATLMPWPWPRRGRVKVEADKFERLAISVRLKPVCSRTLSIQRLAISTGMKTAGRMASGRRLNAIVGCIRRRKNTPVRAIHAIRFGAA